MKFLNFLNENSILPDMHRILTIFSQNNFVDKSIILMEEDTISKNSTKYLIDSIKDDIPEFIIFENYLRERNYFLELDNLKGLPILLKMKSL